MNSAIPDKLQSTLDRAVRLWTLALLSPVAYLMLCELARHLHWVETVAAGEPRLLQRAEGITITAGLILLMLLALGVLLWRRRAMLRTAAGGDAVARDAASRWLRQFYLMLSLADCLGFGGMTAFYLTGQIELMLAGGVGAYLGYVLCYPRRAELAARP